MLRQYDERGRVKDWWLDPYEREVVPKGDEAGDGGVLERLKSR